MSLSVKEWLRRLLTTDPVFPTDAEHVPERGGFALLVSWSDGPHTVECYDQDYAWVSRQQDKMPAYWNCGPARVAACRLISLTYQQWRQHRTIGRCRDLGCFLYDCAA